MVVVLAPNPSTQAQPNGPTFDYIDTSGLSVVSLTGFSDSGRYATVSDGGGRFFHVDIETEIVTEIGPVIGVPLDDGYSVVGREAEGASPVLRVDIRSGATVLDPDANAAYIESLDIDAYYVTRTYLSTSPNGRYTVVRGDAGVNHLYDANFFVYDLMNARQVTDSTGLPSEFGGSLSPQWGPGPDEITYTVREDLFDVPREKVVLDLLTLESRSLDPPPGLDLTGIYDEPEKAMGVYTQTGDAEWVLFRTFAPDLVPDAPEPPNIFRYHRPSGTLEHIVQVQAFHSSTSAQLLANGLVIVSGNFAGQPPGVESQLFLFDGGRLEPLTAPPAPAVVNGPAATFDWRVNSSTTHILFRSLATNLVDGESRESEDEWNLYTVSLPSEASLPSTLDGSDISDPAGGELQQATRCGAVCTGG